MQSRKTRIAAMLGAGVMLLSAPAAGLAQQQDVGQANLGNVISALNNVNAQVRALENVDVNVQDVTVTLVNVEDVLNRNNITALNNALNRNDVDIAVLQDFLNDANIPVNVLIQDVLNNNNVLVSDVVAVDVLSGEVVLFYFQ